MMQNPFDSIPVRSSEITSKSAYISRRDFLKAAGLLAGAFASELALAACSPNATEPAQPSASAPVSNTYKDKTDELRNPLNSFEDITNYNNYYEFTPNKSGVAYVARNFKTLPWNVETFGLIQAEAHTYDVDELVRKYAPEERVYRLRCVEGWSMVIPWVGFPLWKLLKDLQPSASAQFVRFETLMNKKQMPGEGSPYYPFPYQEGLRLDEAMNDLVILATGLYGGELPAQNGGGIRLVVPWKYGFKSIKAIVKIELVEKKPETLWSTVAPREYGFYANVNPNVDHPRWSQATERRIGELARRDTLMFNGYGSEVAHLYDGLDLKNNF